MIMICELGLRSVGRAWADFGFVRVRLRFQVEILTGYVLGEIEN